MVEKRGIKTIVGGPAVSEKLKENSLYFETSGKLIMYLTDNLEKPEINDEKDDETKITSEETIIDFSIFDKKDYFSSEVIIPIKTSQSCYYKRCAFCTHHNNDIYIEFPIGNIRKTIENCIKTGYRYFFLIDDAITRKRLGEISEIFGEEQTKHKIKIHWMCQLRAQCLIPGILSSR